MADAHSATRGAVLVVLRGVGQIMFQGHAGTGACFLAGIALASPWMLLGAILGAIIGPLTARLGAFGRDEIGQGLYGFNATLVGLATLVFLRPSVPTWVLLALGCAASSVVTFACRRFLSFPTYTGPFVVVTWAVLTIARAASGSIEVASAPPELSAFGFPFDVLRGLA
ncbi:urea transporter, partial [Singulisphaera rosea]